MVGSWHTGYWGGSLSTGTSLGHGVLGWYWAGSFSIGVLLSQDILFTGLGLRHHWYLSAPLHACIIAVFVFITVLDIANCRSDVN